MNEIEVRVGYENMDFEAVKGLLKQTYWARARKDEVIKRSMENSLCFGAFLKETGEQIGFARAMTDYATTYYLADVVVDEAHRGLGAGAALVKAATENEQLKKLRGILITKTAAGLYGKFGFGEYDGTFMSKAREE